MRKAHELVTTGTPKQPAFPARWFYGFLRALPGDRAFLPPSLADDSRKLDASVEASGPHDFTVRNCASRQHAPIRPPHSTPNVRDDREAPLLIGRETGELVAVICPTAQGDMTSAPKSEAVHMPGRIALHDNDACSSHRPRPVVHIWKHFRARAF